MLRLLCSLRPRLARPKRPTSLSAKCEAQGLALPFAKRKALRNGVVRSVSWNAGRCCTIQLSKIKLAPSLDQFPSAKHIFKASVACNGREVLRGFPKTPLAQRYAERARGADWEVSSFWFRVSSCWLPRNPKPETFNPQITHPSHTVGKQGVRSMNPFMKHLVIMRFTLNL